MRDLLLSMPLAPAILLVTTLSAVISIIALILIRKNISWENLRENHEVGGFLFNALGLIYAVIVAFVMLMSWQEYTEAIGFSEKEISSLRSLHANSKAFDVHFQKEINNSIKDYCLAVINEEWKLMVDGEESINARNQFSRIRNTYLRENHLGTGKTEFLYQESLTDLDQASDARVLRLATSKKRIPSIVWTVVIIGAVTSIGFSLFFGAKNLKVQSAMTALFAMTNALIMLMIFLLDHPFSGSTGISPEMFVKFVEYLNLNPPI